MKTKTKSLSLLLPFSLISLASVAALSQEVPRERLTKTFSSPNSLTEQCVAIAKLPMGDYKSSDSEREQKLCAIDFYSDKVALCPKTWSTSPGTIVSSFEGLASNVAQAETLCKYNSPLETEAKFKQTMNQSDTSGTFAASSILYYHMARALNTTVGVPVAVYRSMDKDTHYDRVSSKARPSNSRMNVAGWNWLKNAEKNPATYNAKSDLFTKDLKQVYGVLLKESGAHYGAEMIGVKDGNNELMNMQKTPGFLALKANGDLESSIAEGIRSAFTNPTMKTAFASVAPSKVQMVLWMNEISEMTILDYIFSQQDRMDNIDYKWHWAYVDETGAVKTEEVKDDAFKKSSRARMSRIPVPAAMAGKNAVLIQRTWLNDNDAGGRYEYANYAKSKGMITGLAGATAPIAHLKADMYHNLLKLAADFKNKGPNYQVLNTEVRPLGYTDAGDKRFNQLINNTIAIAQILEKNCSSGVLKLDLVSFKDAVKGQFVAPAASCTLQ